MSNSLENTLFQLKFTSKQLQKQANKTLKESNVQKKKLTKILSSSDGVDNEVAKVYASNVIRKKNEHLQLLKLSSRIDAVASRISTAITMNNVSKNMFGVVKGMDRALMSMNLEQITMIMDKFEKQFEDMDASVEAYQSINENNNPSSLVDQDEVDNLINMIHDETGLTSKMDSLPSMANKKVGKVAEEAEETENTEKEDLLAKRLKALRG
ncbi:related to Vacuolar protein-sorting-associated protein 46 [Saccharomycodes ludwigii]|uniref:Related to Vacuolar protein-sorting-associated protein 46 n=1 Tax=Saccharomycodes ludwigii TaxID=36035 RepID=A0A376BA07_9ASCO|nr:hypothetical protein SCDLUD_003639 [Saccharomycodes ludwigii]KAH3900643.1 hypothetical protein SCDLUD_003639 [Saccharomycodes ludwigii]SSD60960.1 related to Vacuolar protein-sorting-associated protein 46 [Saccharomycodes ludwigii]